MILQKLIDDSNDPLTKAFDGCEFAYVYVGQVFGENGLVAIGEAPVSEVVGESLADEVMLLKSAEGMLENRIVGAGLEILQQLGEIVGPLFADAQQVFRSVEIKRLAGLAQRLVRHRNVSDLGSTLGARGCLGALLMCDQAEALARNRSLFCCATSRRTSQSSPIRVPAQRYTLCSRMSLRIRCIRIRFSSGCISRAARMASAVLSMS